MMKLYKTISSALWIYVSTITVQRTEQLKHQKDLLRFPFMYDILTSFSLPSLTPGNA